MRYLTYLVLVVATSLNAGAIHKWVDENGTVHYGDSPPAQTKSENIRVLSAPSNPGKALPRLNQPNANQQSAAGTSGEQPPQASADQAREFCNLARQDLEVINNNSRIKLKMNDGTTRYLTDEEIAERRTQAESEVERYCN